VTRLRRQVATLRQMWAQARQSDREHGVLGPPPLQDPGPPIWIGALSERGRQRAVELADGFIFGGAARPSTIGPAIQSMRPQLSERASPTSASTRSPTSPSAGSVSLPRRSPTTSATTWSCRCRWSRRSTTAPSSRSRTSFAEYAACGLDLLVLLPEVRSLRQLELLSEHVLPEYRH
jgi:hypothetical protein